MDNYDDIVPNECNNNKYKLHYNFNETIICIDKNIPKHLIVNYRLLIEIFGFSNVIYPCISNNRIYKEIFDEKMNMITLWFYIHKHSYDIEYTYYLVCGETCHVSSKDFNNVIKFLEIDYPDIKRIQMLKIAISND
jgi:hypothetical protein